jgi:hypothetical protein
MVKREKTYKRKMKREDRKCQMGRKFGIREETEQAK